MLLHTRGILVMTPEGAMVLTGKRALDYSGGVSAEDNFGIGGYDRVMGPNGQAQYWARDIADACRILLRHYEHTYVAPGERFPRRAPTADPVERDVRTCAPWRRLRARRRHLQRRAQPRTEAPVRRPQGDGRDDRPGPPAARALGRDARRRDRGGLGRSPRRLPRLPDRDRVSTGAAARLRPGRRPGAVDGGHALPARVEEGRARDQRGERKPPGRGARESLGLRRLAGIAARAAARVRRRDRPCGGELRRADRVLRHLALPRRRLRGVLAGAQRVGRDRRGRGLVRLGDRRRARGGRGVRRRGRRPHPARSPRERTRGGDRRRPKGRRRRDGGRRSPRCLRPSTPRSSARWRDEFDDVHSVHRALRVGSLHRIIPAAELRPYLVDAVERGMRRSLEATRPPGAGHATT